MNYTDIFLNHFKEVFPETYLLISTIIILLYAVTYQAALVARSPQGNHPSPHAPFGTTHAGRLAVLGLLLTIGLSASRAPECAGVAHAIFNGTLIIDDLVLLLRTIIVTSALCSILVSFFCAKGSNVPINSFELVLLILFSTLSMLLIVSSYDLISIYLAIELQTLSFYALAAIKRNNEFSTEAGLKYFVLGALSSGLLLFGESIIYGSTGITNLEELTKLFTFWSHEGSAEIGTQIMGFGVLLMLVAFLFKISAAPLHA